MNTSRTVLLLSWFIVVLASVAAAAGLFWPGGAGAAYEFETLRRITAHIWGQGLYRLDTVFIAAGNRGTDAITLLLGVPMLAATTLWYARGSWRGALAHSGVLAYFVYVYASYAVGVAYNPLFLLYVTLFSAGSFALALTFAGTDVAGLQARLSSDGPRREPGIFMLAGGALTLVVWLVPLATAALSDRPPERLDTYTTPVTYALDLALITPSAFAAGVLLLRGRAQGHRLAFPLLGILVLLGPVIAAQTFSQISAGIKLPPGQVIGPVAGFLVLCLLSIRVTIRLLRSVRETRQLP